MSTTIRRFRDELLFLCRAHRVEINSYDEYDGDEEYAGTRWEFAADDGSSVDMQSLQDELTKD